MIDAEGVKLRKMINQRKKKQLEMEDQQEDDYIKQAKLLIDESKANRRKHTKVQEIEQRAAMMKKPQSQ